MLPILDRKATGHPGPTHYRGAIPRRSVFKTGPRKHRRSHRRDHGQNRPEPAHHRRRRAERRRQEMRDQKSRPHLRERFIQVRRAAEAATGRKR